MQTTVRRERAYVPTGKVGHHLREAQRLVAEIQRLEAELSPHREFLLNHLEANNLHKVQCGDFIAQRKVRHNWTYSAQTQREMLALRTTQRWEQSAGLALDTPTVYVSLLTEK